MFRQMGRKSNKEIRMEIEAYNKMQKEREESKEHNIYCGWKEGIYIVECVGHKMKRIKQYKLKGYDLYRNAVFGLEMEGRPTEDYFNS